MKIKNQKGKKKKGRVIRFKNVYVPVNDDGTPIPSRPQFDESKLKKYIRNSNAPLSVLQDAVRNKRNASNKNNVVQFKPKAPPKVKHDDWYYLMHCKCVAGKVKPVGGEAKCLEEYYKALSETHKHKPKVKSVKSDPKKERARIHKDEVSVVQTTPKKVEVSKGYSFNSKKSANDSQYVVQTTNHDLKVVESAVKWLCAHANIEAIPELYQPLITVNAYGWPVPDKKAMMNMAHLKQEIVEYTLSLAEDMLSDNEEEINDLREQVDEHVTNELKLYGEIEELKEQVHYQNQEIRLLEWEVSARGEPDKAAVSLANQFIEIMQEKDAKICELQGKVVQTTNEDINNNLRAKVINQRKELDSLLKEKKRLGEEMWRSRAEAITLHNEKVALQKALKGMSERIKQLQRSEVSSPAKSSPPLNSKGLEAVEDFVGYAYTHTPIEVYAKYVLNDPAWGQALTAYKNALKRERLFYKRMSKRKPSPVRNKYVRGFSNAAIKEAERWARCCSSNYRDIDLIRSAQVVTEWRTYQRWSSYGRKKYRECSSNYNTPNYQRIINCNVGVRGDVTLSNPRLVEGSKWEMKPFSKKAAKFYLPHTPEGQAARKIKTAWNKVVGILNTEINPIARKKKRLAAEREAWAKAEAKRQRAIAKREHEERLKKEEQERLYRQRIREIQRLI